MYPKQTFYSDVIAPNAAEVVGEFLKSKHLDCSHLIHSSVGNTLHKFEITMPYLVLYQLVSPEDDNTILYEFSESGNIWSSFSYEEFKNLGSMPLHFHDFYELTFVLSGKLEMQIGEDLVIYGPGDCCLCNKNIYHREIVKQHTEVLLFMLEEDFVRQMLASGDTYDDKYNSAPPSTFFQQLFADNQKNPFYDAKEYIDFKMKDEISVAPLYEVLRRIIVEITSFHAGKGYMMKALLCRFIELLETEALYTIVTHWAKLSDEEQILYKIACAYENHAGIFTRAEIERMTGYNGDYMERMVKRRTGKTLSEYGRSFLLKKAAMLLTDTNIKIGKICEELGYSNRNYFNKIFIKQYGMTPSEYRRG